jgi:hypothetical protein
MSDILYRIGVVTNRLPLPCEVGSDLWDIHRWVWGLLRDHALPAIPGGPVRVTSGDICPRGQYSPPLHVRGLLAACRVAHVFGTQLRLG